MTTKVCKDINGRTLSLGMYVWYNEAHLCKISQAKLDLVYLIVIVPSISLNDTAFVRRFINEGRIGWVLSSVVRKATKTDLERFEIE